jgi:hypothetical protein
VDQGLSQWGWRDQKGASRIGKSRVPGTCVLCHRKCRNPDGRLYGCSHMVSGHMDHCIAKGASQCKGASRVQGTCAS